METNQENKELAFSKVLRVSHVYGVRFWSIVGLILVFMSLLGWGLLSLLDWLWQRTPEGAHEALLLLVFVIWLLGSSALVQWAYEKIWRRPVVIRDLGSQVAISVGDREDRHSWSDLVKVQDAPLSCGPHRPNAGQELEFGPDLPRQKLPSWNG